MRAKLWEGKYCTIYLYYIYYNDSPSSNSNLYNTFLATYKLTEFFRFFRINTLLLGSGGWRVGECGDTEKGVWGRVDK